MHKPTLKLQGALVGRRPWTAAENAIVRARYVAVGATAVARRLGRSQAAVFVRARRLGVVKKRKWSTADDRLLSELWSEETLRALAKRLRRTSMAVYARAKHLALPLGCPQGYEYLSHAAARAGYWEEPLRRILELAGVRLRRTRGCPQKSKSRTHCVDPGSVDRAVLAWLQTETVGFAARRHGVSGATLRVWLGAAVKAGVHDVSAKPSGRSCHWRVRSDVINRVVCERRAARRAA